MSASAGHLAIALVGFVMTACVGAPSARIWVESGEFEQREAHYAMIRDRIDRLTDSEFVITGHRIVSGSGTVFAVRAYRGGLPLLVDQGAFQKVSVYIPVALEALEGTAVIEDIPGVIAFFSEGSSAFPGRSGCAGYARRGEVKYELAGDGWLRVVMDLHFELFSPGGWKGECGSISYRVEGSFEAKSPQVLSSWEGRAGANIYEESYP